MWYEINVYVLATNQHLFATAKRSITTMRKAEEMWKLLREKFPSDIYGMTLTYYEEIGHPLNMDYLLGTSKEKKEGDKS